jgi:hypothetical protein
METPDTKSIMARVKNFFSRIAGLYSPSNLANKGVAWAAGLVLVTIIVFYCALGIYWSREPGQFSINQAVNALRKDKNAPIITGQRTTAALIMTARTLLDKPGGYLSNDITPPGVFLDNMPNWEFGALVQIRDLAKALRNDMSRSQSQSVEQPDLAEADPLFNYPNDRWIFPSSEHQYRKGIEYMTNYFNKLNDPNNRTNFYARADNLSDWLAIVEKRLGSLSQRLSASVGQVRINTDLAGDSAATESTRNPSVMMVKTPWSQLDDVFFEARGSAWALIEFLKAAEQDFDQVLKKKNALVSMRQIIRELESTQEPLWSPIILNGSGFGLVTNHSLVMASYISSANAAVIDLRNLLQQG